MGTRLRAEVIAGSREAGVAAIEAAFREVARLERMLSSWRSDSELTRLNEAAPGIAVPLSAELAGILGEVEVWAESSGGTFEPAVGALIDAWDLRGAGRRPSAVELERAVMASRRDAFVLDTLSGTVTRRRVGSWMTAGGFGKGAALRAARRVLRAAGVAAGVLDFGGQLLVMGAPGGGQGRLIAVARPSARREPAAWIRVRDVSVATSAASQRFIELDGERIGHILDPRTGRPVPAWGSVTVVAEDPMLADLASTTLFVLGPEAGLERVEEWDEIGALFLEERDGAIEAKWNRAMERWLVRVTE